MPKNTKKSRKVRLIIEAMEDMLFNNTPPDPTPSIAEVAQHLTNNALKDVADSDTRSFLLDRFTRDTDRYYLECAAIIGKECELDYHLITQKFLDEGEPIPTTEEQTKTYLAVFGSGGRGKKAMGARFMLSTIEKPDVMHTVYLQQRAGNSNAISSSVAKLVNQAIDKNTVKTIDMPEQVKLEK